MGILALAADESVADVKFTKDALCVTLKDGRIISVPLAWYPRLFEASPSQRKNWQIIDGGYGIHWPEIDEDLHTAGLLRGAPAPRGSLPGQELVTIFKKSVRPHRKPAVRSRSGSRRRPGRPA